MEDDIGFDSLLKNPPKKKVEKPKPKPKVTEKTKKADKKESTKKEKKSSTKEETKDEEEAQPVVKKPKPYDSTDMLSKVPSSTTLSAADILEREGQDASSLLDENSPNDTKDALSQDISLSLEDGALRPSAGSLTATSSAAVTDVVPPQQPATTSVQQEQPTTIASSTAATTTPLPTPQAPVITSSSFFDTTRHNSGWFVPPLVVGSMAQGCTNTNGLCLIDGLIDSLWAVPD